MNVIQKSDSVSMNQFLGRKLLSIPNFCVMGGYEEASTNEIIFLKKKEKERKKKEK